MYGELIKCEYRGFMGVMKYME